MVVQFEKSFSPCTVIRSRGVSQSCWHGGPVPLKPDSPVEAKGVVYTKRWVVDRLLDLAGYSPEDNLVDSVAVEPAAGDGAFLGPIIERLMESCRKLGRPLSDCRDSLIAFELDDESADRARALAAGVLKDRGVARPLADRLASGGARTGDYLDRKS